MGILRRRLAERRQQQEAMAIERGWLEYTCPDPVAIVKELVRIARTNPVWDRNLNLAFIEDCFGEAALAGRVKFIYLTDVGSMFYLHCRGEGMAGLTLINGDTPTPEQWLSETGSLYLTDMCYTQEVPPRVAMRAMTQHVTAAGVAEIGENVYFRRTTPGRPELLGWFRAR